MKIPALNSIFNPLMLSLCIVGGVVQSAMAQANEPPLIDLGAELERMGGKKNRKWMQKPRVRQFLTFLAPCNMKSELIKEGILFLRTRMAVKVLSKNLKTGVILAKKDHAIGAICRQRTNSVKRVKISRPLI